MSAIHLLNEYWAMFAQNPLLITIGTVLAGGVNFLCTIVLARAVADFDPETWFGHTVASIVVLGAMLFGPMFLAKTGNADAGEYAFAVMATVGGPLLMLVCFACSLIGAGASTLTDGPSCRDECDSGGSSSGFGEEPDPNRYGGYACRSAGGHSGD